MIEVVPDWMRNLEDDDVTFVKNFIMLSGSLKDIAKKYDVTYPTVRLRLDRLISRINVSEQTENEPYVALIKNLALDEKIDYATAKILINEYKKIKGEEK